jgi:hypothetical protein
MSRKFFNTIHNIRNENIEMIYTGSKGLSRISSQENPYYIKLEEEQKIERFIEFSNE